MNKLYISMYHYTRYIKNSRYPAIKGLELEDFKRQLDFFEENFNIITMEEVIEAVLYSSPSAACRKGIARFFLCTGKTAC